MSRKTRLLDLSRSRVRVVSPGCGELRWQLRMVMHSIARDSHAVLRSRRWWVWILPPLVLATLLSLRLFVPRLYLTLVVEDGPLEYMQALLYLSSGVLALSVARRLRSIYGHRLPAMLWLGLSLLLLFTCGEEVSWGQRMLNFDTPIAIGRVNTQGELNIHNLATVQSRLHVAYVCASFGASLACIASHFPPVSHTRWARYFLPRFDLIFWFLPVGVYYLYGNAALSLGLPSYWTELGSIQLWKDQEAVETLFAAGWLLFVVASLRWTRANG
jgi:hypothetical protein